MLMSSEHQIGSVEIGPVARYLRMASTIPPITGLTLRENHRAGDQYRTQQVPLTHHPIEKRNFLRHLWRFKDRTIPSHRDILTAALGSRLVVGKRRVQSLFVTQMVC